MSVTATKTKEILDSLIAERNVAHKLAKIETNSIKSIRLSGKQIALDNIIECVTKNSEGLAAEQLRSALLTNSRNELRRMSHLEDDNGDAPFSNGQIDAHKFTIAILAEAQ